MPGETTVICRMCTEELPVVLVLGEQDQFQRTDLIRVRAAKVSSMDILEARNRHAGNDGHPTLAEAQMNSDESRLPVERVITNVPANDWVPCSHVSLVSGAAGSWSWLQTRS
jgi:hypothetical protein